MNGKKALSFEQLFQEAQQQNEYWAERAKLEFAVQLYRLMEAVGISKKEFAQQAGTSPAYITKVFRGDANFAIGTMVKLIRALDPDASLKISIDSETLRQGKSYWRAEGFLSPINSTTATVAIHEVGPFTATITHVASNDYANNLESTSAAA